MGETVISVQNLSKRYRLGTGHTDVLAERLQRVVSAPLRALRPGKSDDRSHLIAGDNSERELWALRDVSPEILLVDEVLAVGDAEFQRKCLGKMQEVSEHGRTVVFVSHNLAAVQRLCSRAYWIGSGRIAGEGPTAEVVAAYMRQSGLRQEG